MPTSDVSGIIELKDLHSTTSKEMIDFGLWQGLLIGVKSI